MGSEFEALLRKEREGEEFFDFDGWEDCETNTKEENILGLVIIEEAMGIIWSQLFLVLGKKQ